MSPVRGECTTYEYVFLNSTPSIRIKCLRAARSWGAAGVAAQAVGNSEQVAAIYSCSEPLPQTYKSTNTSSVINPQGTSALLTLAFSTLRSELPSLSHLTLLALY